MKFVPLPHKNQITDTQYNFGCLEETFQRFTDERIPHVEGFHSIRSQLKYISNFLRTCYIEYILPAGVPFITVIQNKIKHIFSGCTISLQYFFAIL